jgi:hypothetical protein
VIHGHSKSKGDDSIEKSPQYKSAKESKPLVEKVCNHPNFILHGHA